MTPADCALGLSDIPDRLFDRPPQRSAAFAYDAAAAISLVALNGRLAQIQAEVPNSRLQSTSSLLSAELPYQFAGRPVGAFGPRRSLSVDSPPYDSMGHVNLLGNLTMDGVTGEVLLEHDVTPSQVSAGINPGDRVREGQQLVIGNLQGGIGGAVDSTNVGYIRLGREEHIDNTTLDRDRWVSAYAGRFCLPSIVAASVISDLTRCVCFLLPWCVGSNG